MSRGAFILGLVVSLVVHVWLLWGPTAFPIAQAVPASAEVEVVPLARPSEPAPAPVQAEPPPPASPPVDLEARHRPAPAPEPDGDLAGQREGESHPPIRIDWGSPADGRRVMEAGGMKLVVLGADQRIRNELVFRDGRWQAVPLGLEPEERYSNRLRVVERVPAFAGVEHDGGGLAVLMPARLDRQIDQAARQALAARGLASGQVQAIGGRFCLEVDGLVFRVTHVQSTGD